MAESLTCPRCGGHVQRQQIPGSATDPRDPLPSDHHFWCSPCGKFWHPIEMPRKGVAVRFDPPTAARRPEDG
jgi:hypothetical protein